MNSVSTNSTASSLKVTSWAGFKKVGSQFFKSFAEHDLMTLSAALAFYTALALAPLLLITLSVVGLLGESAKDALMLNVQNLMGAQAGEAVNSIVEAANDKPKAGGIAGTFGVIVLLFSASGVFAQLQGSLNVIWKATSAASSGFWGWIRKRLLSMGMVMTLGFLAIVSLIASTALSLVFTNENEIWRLVSLLVSAIVFSAMFALVFKYLPDVKLQWKEAWFGGMITAVLFLIGKNLIGLYLGKSAVGSAYGAAGSLIVLLAWVYYSAIIVFSGAEITRIVAAQEGNLEAQKANGPKPNSLLNQAMT